jgi:hypothetical protein
MLPCSRGVLSQDYLISGAAGVEPRTMSDHRQRRGREDGRKGLTNGQSACRGHVERMQWGRYTSFVGDCLWGKSDCKTT